MMVVYDLYPFHLSSACAVQGAVRGTWHGTSHQLKTNFAKNSPKLSILLGIEAKLDL